MNICVCGWYGREYDELYMTLYKARKKHDIMVVAKRQDKFWRESELPYVTTDNTGLEWGAYNYFVKHLWKSGDTLFMHDDISIMPIIQDGATVMQESIFDKIAEIDSDHAYIFEGRADDVFNNGQHGRALYLSDGLMRWLQSCGIWYDPHNQGYTGGKKPDGDCLHYNEGTRRFSELMKTAHNQGYNTLNKIYVPAFAMAHRGTIKNWEV